MVPVLRTSVPGPNSLALAAELRQYESRNVTFVDSEGRFPIFWESAADCLVTDVDGNTFLDLTSAFGVAAVGHTNPQVVAAVQDQVAKLIHGMGDVHPAALKVALLKKIAQHTPGDLGGAILGANGSDAVEAALKTARLYSGKSGVLAFEGGYHGLSYGALAVTSRGDFRAPFGGQVPEFGRHVAFGDIESVETTLNSDQSIGAILFEPIQGRGGIVVPPDDFLPGLRALADRYGVVLIADEIFTGWGRTGNWFACDHEGIVPDIMCIGKAMGGGFPISACVSRPHIMAAWVESTGEALHTSTFLGSPIGCRAAIAAISEIEDRNLTEQSRARGAYFKARLEALAENHRTLLREARGRGLMLGLEFADRERSLAMVYELLARGIIVLPAGGGNVLEFVPPLTISTTQIDWAIAQIDAALAS